MPTQVHEAVGRRIVSFGVASAVSLVTPIAVLPLVAAATDASGWAALAVGQSVGSLAGILVAFGWPMVGPVELARSPAESRGQLFFESLVSRAVLMLVALPLIIAACTVASPAGQLATTLTTGVACASLGLSSNWVAVGLGRPWTVVCAEALPKLAILLAAAWFIHRGGSILAYPIGIGAASIVGIALFSALVLRPRTLPRPWFDQVRSRLIAQVPAAATAAAASAYSAAALFLVALSTTVHQTALMSSADRLYSVGLVAIVALGSAFQAWVVVPDPGLARARRRRALQAHVTLGLVGMVVFTAMAPWVAGLLFGGDLAPGHAIALGYGLAFLSLSVTTSLAQHFLIPLGRVSSLLRATIIGAVVGLVAIPVLGHGRGAAGAAVGLALSEGAVLGLVAWAWLATRPSDGTTTRAEAWAGSR